MNLVTDAGNAAMDAAMSKEYSAAAAARHLGYSERTARAVAEKKAAAGDTAVRKVGTNWVASLGWWSVTLSTPDDYGHKPRKRTGE